MSTIRDARGSTAAEYVLASACVGLFALGAWTALGSAMGDEVTCVASVLASGGGGRSCGAGGDGAVERAASASPPGVSGPQSLDALLPGLPQSVVQALRDQHTAVVLSDTTITSVRPDLANERPRFWPKGTSWADANGLMDPRRNQVVVALGRPNGTFSAAYVAAHEIGHAIDLPRGMSKSAAFIEAYDASGFDVRSRASMEETFADSFAMFVTDRSTLRARYPQLERYWAAHIGRLPEASRSTLAAAGDTLRPFGWDDVNPINQAEKAAGAAWGAARGSARAVRDMALASTVGLGELGIYAWIWSADQMRATFEIARGNYTGSTAAREQNPYSRALAASWEQGAQRAGETLRATPRAFVDAQEGYARDLASGDVERMFYGGTSLALELLPFSRGGAGAARGAGRAVAESRLAAARARVLAKEPRAIVTNAAPDVRAPRSLARERMLAIMHASARMSRTTSHLLRPGRRMLARRLVPRRVRSLRPLRRHLAPHSDLAPAAALRVARRNFARAAELVVDEADHLPLSLSTAIRVNKVLTEDLVPQRVWGEPAYRRDPSDFYRWLESSEARELGARDPVALAERVHFEISKLDSFPDGNGRTARLMADLALIRHGRAPAYFTTMEEYFERGNARSHATRDEQRAYFREAAERGQETLAAAAAVRRSDVWTQPYPGVEHLVRTLEGPTRVHVVRVRLGPDVHVRATRPSEGGQTVSDFAREVDADIAVNADFYDYDALSPLGLAIGDGEVWPGTADSRWGFIAFGRESAAPRIVGPGELAPRPEPWMTDVVAGRPLIVDRGLPLTTNFVARLPRTAIGLSADGQTLLIATADGYSPMSIGASAHDVAEVMAELGAWRAINLDGGGSSALFIDGEGGLVSTPPHGIERPVANHLAIVVGRRGRLR